MIKELEAFEEIIDKFAEQMIKANKEKLTATNKTNAIEYLYRTPQVRLLNEALTAVQLVKTKSKKNYNLALVVDSGTYEQYCKQFEYFLNDYKENAGAFEIWEEDKYSFEEYNLLREVFVYE